MPASIRRTTQTLIVGTDGLLRKIVANHAAPAEGRLKTLLSRSGTPDVLGVMLVEPLRPVLAADPDRPRVAVLAGLVFAWKDFVRRANDYVLTNHRLIQEIGILSRRSMDSRLDKINNVEHRQTLWGRLLSYGDVEIDTASETGAAVFRNVSHPLEFKNAILAAAEQYRAGGRMPSPRPPAPPAPSGCASSRPSSTTA